MAHYLVLAHQTAESEELLRTLRDIAYEEPDARFTLLVPATRVNHLLTFVEGEAYARAEEVAAEASRLFEGYGLRVVDARAADESPMQAISDGLGTAEFDAIVISTLPPGVSRWLRQDIHAKARRRYGLPVISVVATQSRTRV
jgi:hypothetical protein